MNGISMINMTSGVYRCPDDIKNFKIRVKLKKLIGTIPNISEPINCAAESEDVTFFWQQKRFSKTEFKLYAKRRNCSSDLEKEYHEIIKKSTEKPYRLFSYVQNNDLCDEEQNVTTEIRPRMSKLHEEMSNLTLNKNSKDTTKVKTEVEASISLINESIDFDMNKTLKNSIVNAYSENPYEYMVIMADLGNIDAESQLWHKSEHMICLIKYDKQKKILAIFPDFSKNHDEPYVLETDVDRKIYFYFTLEHVSNFKLSETVIKNTGIAKIIEKCVYKPGYRCVFHSPPSDTYHVNVCMEILTAKNFEYDNIFIHYNVDLPEDWYVEDSSELTGTTQSCKTKGSENLANFSYYFDLTLQYTSRGDEDELPKCLTIYFQVISMDYWDRYRIEGLTYKCIPVYAPGKYTVELQCLKLPDKSYTENLKKYFVGDYGNINDLSWISIPRGHKGNTLNKYGVPTIGTGTIQIRMNVLSQSSLTDIFPAVINKDTQDGDVEEVIKSKTLNKTVNEVIEAYKKAKETMIQTRNKLTFAE